MGVTRYHLHLIFCLCNTKQLMSLLPCQKLMDMGATIEFRAIQGQHMKIGQNLLFNETDNISSFCYSMI